MANTGAISDYTARPDPLSVNIGDLSDKVALITGASSGLGRAIALAYAAAGAYVVSADLTPTPPTTPAIAEVTTRHSSSNKSIPTVDLINQRFPSRSAQNSSRAAYVTCDVSNSESVREAVAITVKTFGRLDIMVNNAGLNSVTKTARFRDGFTCRLHETGDDVFDRDVNINVRGVWHGIKHAVPRMLAQEPHPSGDRGWIINMSSVSGISAAAGIASYCTSKAACFMLTKAAALDYAPDKIHVNCINPGFVDTPLLDSFISQKGGPEASEKMAQLNSPYPWGRVGLPEEIARMAVFLAGPGASFCTGQGYIVDGGISAQ